MAKDEIKKIVKEGYSKIAKKGSDCGCRCSCDEPSKEEMAIEMGYSLSEIKAAPDANLGLGCGNPLAFAKIAEGMTVLDLGSGAGFDAFIAAKKVGDKGKVIGVDFTPEMIDKAEGNAKKYAFSNVEFRLGDIEELPIEDASVDVVISNCVINLAPDKKKVFEEAFRVLKHGGRLLVSDIVLLEKLTEQQKKDNALIVGCVAGALLKQEYISLIENAGFEVNILSEHKNIDKPQYEGFPLESLKVDAYKPAICKCQKHNK